MKPLRTAIIGCGRFARKHAVHLASLEEISLVGFCSRSFESADQYNQEFARGKGHVFTDYEQLFTELELDLAYICLPPFAHGNEVELACRYGVNLLIEKPIALNMDLALQMEKQVRKAASNARLGSCTALGGPPYG